MTLFDKTQLCKCPTIELRNKIVALLGRHNITSEKKLKRETSLLKADFDHFNTVHYIYVDKKQLEKAKEVLKENQILFDTEQAF